MRALPSASLIKDAATRMVCEALVDALSILGRLKGPIRDSAVTVSDLQDIGVVGVYNDQTLYDPKEEGAPEIKDTPILNTQGGYADELSITVTGTGSTKTVTLSIDTGGYFVVRLWLTDTTNPARPTLVPPTGGDKVDWMIVTASDGTYSEQVSNLTVKNWYVNGMVVGKINAGTLLSFT